MPGDFCDSHIWDEGYCYWHPLLGAQDAAKHTKMYRSHPHHHPMCFPAPNVHSVRMRNIVLKHAKCTLLEGCNCSKTLKNLEPFFKIVLIFCRDMYVYSCMRSKITCHYECQIVCKAFIIRIYMKIYEKLFCQNELFCFTQILKGLGDDNLHWCGLLYSVYSFEY